MARVGHVFTESLPDLIGAQEYDRYPDGTLIRIRICISEHGVEILGDGIRPELVEQVLTAITDGASGPVLMEQMLCG
jgi:FtsH ternary system-associated peptide